MLPKVAWLRTCPDGLPTERKWGEEVTDMFVVLKLLKGRVKTNQKEATVVPQHLEFLYVQGMLFVKGPERSWKVLNKNKYKFPASLF